MYVVLIYYYLRKDRTGEKVTRPTLDICTCNLIFSCSDTERLPFLQFLCKVNDYLFHDAHKTATGAMRY